MNRGILLIASALSLLPAKAQININTAMAPTELVEDVLLGGGVSVSNITYNGVAVTASQAGSGSFTNGNSTNLGLDAGLILSSGLATSIPGAAVDFGSDQLGTGSDPDLVDITTPGNDINDKAILEFDFIPNGDSLKFSYVFGSEEYPTFNCSATFNDVFGFFLSGPGITGPYTNNAINIALVPGTALPVGIANIHGPEGSCGPANEEFYVSNAGGATIALNGFTTVLQAEAAVTCGETYHIKLAIGDAGDESYNSAVFLQAGSFASDALPTVSAATLFGDATAAEGCDGATFSFFRPGPADTAYTVNYFLTGTATGGVDYNMPSGTVTIPAGQDSVVVPFEAFDDGVEENFESVIINVFLINTCGDTVTNSALLALVDYPPLVITTETNILLECDQNSIPLFASVTGGFGEVTMAWGDTLPTGMVYVPGMLNGTYTVSATDQCPQTVTETIVVDAGCDVIIPNVVSTGTSDGVNDRFVVEGIAGRENHVQIWDRWGKEVLNTRNYQNNFAFRGLNDGVYFYHIRVKEDDYTGYVQVLGGN